MDMETIRQDENYTRAMLNLVLISQELTRNLSTLHFTSSVKEARLMFTIISVSVEDIDNLLNVLKVVLEEQEM